MKIKKVVFTHTGEVRKPKADEWFYSTSIAGYCKATLDFISTPVEIVSREEILEDWKPKENELVRYVYIDFANTPPVEILRCSFYPENIYHKNALAMGLMFPDKSNELAEAKLKAIKKLLNS